MCGLVETTLPHTHTAAYATRTHPPMCPKPVFLGFRVLLSVSEGGRVAVIRQTRGAEGDPAWAQPGMYSWTTAEGKA